MSPLNFIPPRAGPDVGDVRSDIGFLASPPSNLAPIAPVFNATLETIHLLVRDFEASFAYIKGFDAYTVQVSPPILVSLNPY